MLSVETSPTGGLSGGLCMLAIKSDTQTKRKLSFGPNLEETKEKIEKLESPLLAKKGDHANNVYPIRFDSPEPLAVFKPGKGDTIRTILCGRIARILDLEECIPPTIEARAAFVISKEDLSIDQEPIVYEKVFIDDSPWYADLDAAATIDNLEDDNVTLEGGYSFRIEHEDDGYTLTPIDETAENHPLAHQSVRIACWDSQQIVVKHTSIHPIKMEGNSPYVERGASRLQLRSSQDYAEEEDDLFETDAPDQIPSSGTLLEEDVDGFIQPWVQNVRPDVSQLSMSSIINNLFLAILCRYQDGKVSFSDDSNFLFTKEDNVYNLTAIDLGETWPESNDYQDEACKIATLRLGLLKFPQTSQPLSGDDKEHCERLFTKIKANRALLLEALSEAAIDNREKVKAAFKEVLDRLGSFQQDSYSLRDIVFHVFPVYKAQYMTLQEAGKRADVIADNVGLHSVDDILKMH
ncbi:MAG: hypothetical protein JSS12_00200 [Verrucomicrobia bacterium]|nr:hypothetical protein [Verrucomicrobiota bacterium]